VLAPQRVRRLAVEARPDQVGQRCVPVVDVAADAGQPPVQLQRVADAVVQVLPGREDGRLGVDQGAVEVEEQGLQWPASSQLRPTPTLTSRGTEIS
jgi:predicted GTPase